VNPFFGVILMTNKCSHPLIYIRGIKYNHLVAIINFVYNGEINIIQEYLSEVLCLMIDKLDGILFCNVYGKSSKHKPVTRYHAETHIEGMAYIC